MSDFPNKGLELTRKDETRALILSTLFVLLGLAGMGLLVYALLGGSL